MIQPRVTSVMYTEQFFQESCLDHNCFHSTITDHVLMAHLLPGAFCLRNSCKAECLSEIIFAHCQHFRGITHRHNHTLQTAKWTKQHKQIDMLSICDTWSSKWKPLTNTCWYYANSTPQQPLYSDYWMWSSHSRVQFPRTAMLTNLVSIKKIE